MHPERGGLQDGLHRVRRERVVVRERRPVRLQHQRGGSRHHRGRHAGPAQAQIRIADSLRSVVQVNRAVFGGRRHHGVTGRDDVRFGEAVIPGGPPRAVRRDAIVAAHVGVERPGRANGDC